MNGIDFKNKVAMRNFGYDREAGLNEEKVKEAVAAFLRERGCDVFIGKKRGRGPDMRAITKEGWKLIVEAKGEGSRDVMYNNFFVQALGETIQRMNEQAVEYGIALPAHQKFVRLVDELSHTPRFALRLNFYLVRPSKTGDHEVGLLSWQTS